LIKRLIALSRRFSALIKRETMSAHWLLRSMYHLPILNHWMKLLRVS